MAGRAAIVLKLLIFAVMTAHLLTLGWYPLLLAECPLFLEPPALNRRMLTPDNN